MERNISSYEANNDQQPDPRIIMTNFFGTWIQTTVTSRPEIIHQWIYHQWQFYRMLYGNRLIVGVVGTRCLLIQLSHTPYVPDILRWFIVDVNIHFVGIQNRFDAERLWNNEHRLLVSNLINIGDSVNIGPSRPSMENLAEFVLGFPGVRTDPCVGMSNWSAEHLTVDQVQYAVVDAFVSFQVGRIERIWEVLNSWWIY
ncbi:hypothetical protein MKX03_002430 [Papaver bracteatum]|nr:hypothetical protein MKX03_002430 [Papaver bracteatum]